MKKIIILAGVVAMMTLSACGSGSVSLRSEKDSLAYAVGLDLGAYIKTMDSTLSVNVISSAISDVLNNNQKMDQEQAYAFLRDYFTVRKPARAKAVSDELLAAVEKRSNVQKTESGLLYEVISEGSSVKAVNDTDKVRVMYEGKLLNGGKIFDSSMQRGDTVEFALNQVIPGWTEGIKLVGEGGKIRLWIPAELGYGEQGAGQDIGPNEALEFEVELFGVSAAN